MKARSILFVALFLFVLALLPMFAENSSASMPLNGEIPVYTPPTAPAAQPGDDRVVSTTIGAERQALYWHARALAAEKQIDIDHTYMLAQRTYINEQAASRDALAKKFESDLQAEQRRSAFRADLLKVTMPIMIAETLYISLRLITGR